MKNRRTLLETSVSKLCLQILVGSNFFTLYVTTCRLNANEKWLYVRDYVHKYVQYICPDKKIFFIVIVLID